jgi:DNA processing protein
MAHELKKEQILTLLFLRGISRKTVHSWIQKLDFSPCNLQELFSLVQKYGRSSGISLKDLEAAQDKVAHSLFECEKNQIQVIGFFDAQYPEQLRVIPDPPVILYVRGNIDCLKPEKAIAIIGTRNPTDFGRASGKRIAKRLAERGLIIVSGLAEGCDTAAHEGCLEGEGQTVAVLAHGFHKIYPAKNRYLAEEIVDSGGCLVTEYGMGVGPFKSSFVERDRLQSGLSSAVLVVETDIKGGTMHTAEFCREQGRVLACLNHPLNRQSEKSRGNQYLISQRGAVPLWEPAEVENFIQRIFASLLVISPSEELSESDLHIDEKTSQFGQFTTEILLTYPELEKFRNKCDSDKKTPEQVIEMLIRQYISVSVEEHNGYEPQHLSKAVESQPVEQLSIDGIQSTQANYSDQTKSQAKVSEGLTQKDLAERLGVSPGTLSKKKQGSDFSEWTQSKDPEGFGWEFSTENRRYQPCF